MGIYFTILKQIMFIVSCGEYKSVQTFGKKHLIPIVLFVQFIANVLDRSNNSNL
jgi:hypothetical protein